MRFEDNRTAKKIMRKRINIIDQIITKKVLKKYEKTFDRDTNISKIDRR